MAITKRINIIPDDSLQRVHVSQGDIGRTLQFVLYEGSTSYTIPTGATVKIQGTKPSGLGFSETCTWSGSTVTIDTTEAMTQEFGGIPTEIRITDGDDVLGTSNFMLVVERNPHGDEVIDGNIDTFIPEMRLLVNQMGEYADEISSTYHAYGSPWVASTVAQMTDTDKIYVYVGSETGYTNGNWYYHNGTAWVSGGVYNSVAVQTDKTLSIEDMPADAKAVGDEISDLKSDISVPLYFDGLDFTRYSSIAAIGSTNGSNGSYNSSQTYRVTVLSFCSFPEDTTVHIASGYQLGVVTYANGAYSDSGWKEGSYQISGNVPFKFTIQKKNTYTAANISTFLSQITIDYPLFKRLDNYEVIHAYSSAGSSYPKIDLLSGSVKVYVDAVIAVADISSGETINISTYNNNPTTFTIGNNESLVFDLSTSAIKTVSNNNYSDDYILLLAVSSMGTVFGGKWIPYITQQALYIEYKEPSIPYSPKKSTIEQSSVAGDQSICEVGDWIVCFDAQDSDGLVYILDKTTKERIKTMTHTLGHAYMLSYCEESDSLLISGPASYILQNAIAFIDDESNVSFSPSDCVIYNLPLGVFGETEDAVYCPTQGTADTLQNYSIKKYRLEMSANVYTGTYEELATYVGNYRMPVIQDAKFYNGFLYQGVGYRKASVYKIAFENLHYSYKIVESYDVPNGEIYELEGVIIDDGEITASARLVADITQKFFITMKR